ncbi:hypothetical protein K432DRAFT_408327 [Lepidopterella palustris CBS 459.81]|uniref:BHLH domain-containing protein n=1 Tax=Lepidopterella palustris CBS 459.81 TaxID=1314670 RepID=A0A8E2JBE3_9PEZI|nr:hypothetical protein K432DRAFT_408327 [Lepidopterella palustris CBS 459.81]
MAVDWAPFTQADTLEGGLFSCSSSDCSPASENFSYPDAFDRANMAGTYATQPDHSLDDWLTADFYDGTVSGVEAPVEFAPKNQAVFNSMLPAAVSVLNQWQTVNPLSFGRAMHNPNEGVFAHASPFGTISTDSATSSCGSPQESSPTPSLCEDGSQLDFEARPARQASSDASDASLKRDSPSDVADEEPAPKRVQRKRGRPRLNQSETVPANYSSADSLNSKSRVNRRLPHNQVERKYREGLNSELERLRRAVPTLPQRDSGDLTGPPKPSKATVLASAIDYIKFMESERERLAEENERLREMRPIRGNGENNNRADAKLSNFGWNKGRPNSSFSSSISVSR